MIYAATITIVKGGTEDTATIVRLPVSPGLIWLFEVDFPAGCCGLAHLQIFDSNYQVLPASIDESLHADNVTLSFPDLYLKQSAPNELILKVWNEDETYNHTIQVRLGIAMGKVEMSRYMPALAFDNFQEMVAEILANQEALRQAQLTQALEDLTGLKNE